MWCPFPLPLGKALGWSEPGVSRALGEGEERMGVSKGPFPGTILSPFAAQSLSPPEDAGVRRQYCGLSGAQAPAFHLYISTPGKDPAPLTLPS